MVRSSRRWYQMPVIAFIDNISDEILDEVNALGVNEFIQKPVSKKLLQIRVKEMMKKHPKAHLKGDQSKKGGAKSP